MKPQPRKGQTSLDFLMTYGWAVLLVVVVVASLFALGVFNAGSFLGPRATGFSQIGVIAWNVNAAGILSLKLQNFAGMDINVINIEATYGTSHFPYDITNVSIPNSKISDTFTVGAISGLAPGQYYTMPLRITYVDLNGFNYTETGTISGTVGAGAVPPSIRINSPSSNSLLNNRTINVSVTVWGNNLTSTDISIINESGIVDSITIPQLGTYSVLLNVTDDGVYNITALAHYSDGGSASATASNITVNISAQLGLQCGDPLDIPDHVYTLTGDANSSGICFTIAADNVTLDCAGYVIRGDGSGNGIYLFGHSNVTVKNCIVSGFGAGINIRAASSSNNTVTNSTFNDNSAGINIWSGASNNTITGNTVNNNTNYGIRLASSSNNIIANNTASSNGDSGFYSSDSSGNNYISNTAHGNTWQGIWLDQSSTLNTIEGNAITSNYYGVRFDGSSSNTIVGNNISGSYGAVYSSGNLFYDNFFSGNYQTTLGLGANAWNTTLNCSLGATTNIVGGPCIGGNFWADPSGTGFSENCTTNGSSNSSGICTVPYVIDGSNVDELPLTTNFTGLRLAVDDSVWVAHASSGNVYRINKTTNDTIGSPIAVDSHPYTIAVDPYSVWVANANSNTVSRINKTDTGDVTRISNSSFNNPWGVAVDQDSAWVANNNGNTVSRINKTDTGDVTTIYGIGSGPVGIAVDLDSVWTANNNGNTVSRINKTNTGDVTAIPVCTMPAGIAVGNDSVWVACQDSLGTISIINRTDTNQVTNITVGSYHGGIAIDQDSVWVVNNWGDYGGTVSRINETTGSVIGSPIPAGSNGCCQSSGQTGPFGIAVDQDSVWVTNLGGVVYRIDKATDTSTTIAVGQNPYSLGDMTGYAYDRIFLQHTNLTPAPSCVEPRQASWHGGQVRITPPTSSAATTGHGMEIWRTRQERSDRHSVLMGAASLIRLLTACQRSMQTGRWMPGSMWIPRHSRPLRATATSVLPMRHTK